MINAIHRRYIQRLARYLTLPGQTVPQPAPKRSGTLRANRSLSHGDADNGNLLIQGDNLHALKALLVYFRGNGGYGWNRTEAIIY